MKLTKKPFRGSASIGFSMSVAGLRITQSVIQFLLVEDPLPTKPQAAGRRYGGRKSARYSRLTGGKLEENPDFSLRRVTFR
jgi:hypothetical protein